MPEETQIKLQVPMDVPSALERIDGDRSFLQELLELYVTDFAEKYSLLQKAVSDCNFETIREIGHSIKGSSANLSLHELQNIALTIEISGKERNIHHAEAYMKELKQAFERLNDFLLSQKNSKDDGQLEIS